MVEKDKEWSEETKIRLRALWTEQQLKMIAAWMKWRKERNGDKEQDGSRK
jgi:hypothetical protein